MKYASNNIRNILIAGHAGSGKTTLTEALVYFRVLPRRMGRVEDGTTISDFDPEEAKRKPVCRHRWSRWNSAASSTT